jgi:hypothetical protein
MEIKAMVNGFNEVIRGGFQRVGGNKDSAECRSPLRLAAGFFNPSAA